MSRARRLAEIAKANQPAFESESAMNWWLADATPKPAPPPSEPAKSEPPKAAVPPPEIPQAVAPPAEVPQAFAPPAEPLQAVELPEETPAAFAPAVESIQAVELPAEFLAAFAASSESLQAEPPQAASTHWESSDFSAPIADPLPDVALPSAPLPSVSLFGSRFEVKPMAEEAASIPAAAGEPEPDIYQEAPPLASTPMFLDNAFGGAAGVATEAQSEETLQDLASRLSSLREKFLALGRKNQEEL